MNSSLNNCVNNISPYLLIQNRVTGRKHILVCKATASCIQKYIRTFCYLISFFSSYEHLVPGKVSGKVPIKYPIISNICKLEVTIAKHYIYLMLNSTFSLNEHLCCNNQLIYTTVRLQAYITNQYSGQIVIGSSEG